MIVRKILVVIAAIVFFIVVVTVILGCLGISRMAKHRKAARVEARAMVQARVGRQAYESKNYGKAVSLFQQALECPHYENAELRGMLANCYFRGMGIKQDLALCRVLATKAAELEDELGAKILKRLNRIEEDSRRPSLEKTDKCICIHLAKDGALSYRGKPVTMEEAAALSKRAIDEDKPLLIDGPGDVPESVQIELVKKCKQHGVKFSSISCHGK